MNESLSVSYTEESSEKKQKAKAALANTATRTDVEMEIVTIDVAYTIGGATLGVSNSETTNDSYTAGDEVNETIVALTLAF